MSMPIVLTGSETRKPRPVGGELDMANRSELSVVKKDRLW